AHPAAFPDLAALAAAAGVGPVRLHALCREHYHATPGALLTAARCETAARLLARGAAVEEAALAAGFPAPEDLPGPFRRAAGMTAAAYRELGTAREPSFALALPRGYLPEPTLRAWGRDARSLSERVQGRHIARALPTPDGDGALLHVELARGVAPCRIEALRPV